MLFVPLPLIATLFLVFLLARFVLVRDMTSRPHQLFATLIALYAVQSLLSSLYWGYNVAEIVPFIALLAPVLPSLAYFSYKALSGNQIGLRFWPLAVILANWLAFSAVPAISDLLILITYIGFGVLLLRLCWNGVDQLSLSPFNDARELLTAMCLTGIALVVSGLTDIYVIFDFINNEGRNTGFVLTFVQTTFALAIGISATLGRAAQTPEKEISPANVRTLKTTDTEDDEILTRLEGLFEHDRLHTSEDLSLRRISRRLGVSDRHVSNAVNRLKQMSVSQYVNEFRIKEACKLLLETDETVLNVSLAAGFATKSNFNREFLRVTGQTPSQWRSQNSQ